MIDITEKAAERVRQIVRSQGKPEGEYGLRIFIKGGGCAGFQYCFDIENTQKDNDQVFERHGVKVYVDNKSILRLVGTEVDYFETLMESGFKVSNPNATSTCGCGISFSA